MFLISMCKFPGLHVSLGLHYILPIDPGAGWCGSWGVRQWRRQLRQLMWGMAVAVQGSGMWFGWGGGGGLEQRKQQGAYEMRTALDRKEAAVNWALQASVAYQPSTRPCWAERAVGALEVILPILMPNVKVEFCGKQFKSKMVWMDRMHQGPIVPTVSS